MKESQKRLCLRAGKSGWIFLMLLFVILFSRANTHAVVREFRVQGFDIIWPPAYRSEYAWGELSMPIDFNLDGAIDVMIGYSRWVDNVPVYPKPELGVGFNKGFAEIISYDPPIEYPFLEQYFTGDWCAPIPFETSIGNKIEVPNNTDDFKYRWVMNLNAYIDADWHYLCRNKDKDSDRLDYGEIAIPLLPIDGSYVGQEGEVLHMTIGSLPQTEGVIGVRFFAPYEYRVSEWCNYGYIHYSMFNRSDKEVVFTVLGWAYETEYNKPIIAKPLGMKTITPDNDPLEFQLEQDTDGGLTLSWKGVPGAVYQLERAENPWGSFEEWGEEITPEAVDGAQLVSMTQRLSSEDTAEQCFWRIKRVK